MKAIEYTIKLVCDQPVTTDGLVAALKDYGEAEVTNYRIKPQPRKPKEGA